MVVENEHDVPTCQHSSWNSVDNYQNRRLDAYLSDCLTFHPKFATKHSNGIECCSQQGDSHDIDHLKKVS